MNVILSQLLTFLAKRLAQFWVKFSRVMRYNKKVDKEVESVEKSVDSGDEEALKESSRRLRDDIFE